MVREWRATGASWAVLSGLLAFSLFLGMLPGCGGGTPGPGGTGVTVSPTSLAFVTTDTSKTLTIDGGAADTWTCTASDPWLSATPKSGTGSAQGEVHLYQDPHGTARTPDDAVDTGEESAAYDSLEERAEALLKEKYSPELARVLEDFRAARASSNLSATEAAADDLTAILFRYLTEG